LGIGRGLARLGSAWPGRARIGSDRLGSARLGSARLGSARLGPARLGSAWLGSALPLTPPGAKKVQKGSQPQGVYKSIIHYKKKTLTIYVFTYDFSWEVLKNNNLTYDYS
jgi:hypothetical protein